MREVLDESGKRDKTIPIRNLKIKIKFVYCLGIRDDFNTTVVLYQASSAIERSDYLG